MKSEEDEAFDELAKRQGAWGGGFKAKQAMAADKLQDGKCKYCVDGCIACDARAQPAQEVDYWIREATAARQAEMALRRELEAQPAQEPAGWADLQKKAQQIVESKFLWKRFIDGTPLANDIACWMADFARQYTTLQQRERVVFPTMLRKMWSGGEVQAWLDENVNKEQNNG